MGSTYQRGEDRLLVLVTGKGRGKERRGEKGSRKKEKEVGWLIRGFLSRRQNAVKRSEKRGKQCPLNSGQGKVQRRLGFRGKETEYLLLEYRLFIRRAIKQSARINHELILFLVPELSSRRKG